MPYSTALRSYLVKIWMVGATLETCFWRKSCSAAPIPYNNPGSTRVYMVEFKVHVVHWIYRNMSAILTHFVNWSTQASLMRSATAGLWSVKFPRPSSDLADKMASLMAKKTEEPRKRGGSPTACW